MRTCWNDSLTSAVSHVAFYTHTGIHGALHTSDLATALSIYITCKCARAGEAGVVFNPRTHIATRHTDVSQLLSREPTSDLSVTGFYSTFQPCSVQKESKITGHHSRPRVKTTVVNLYVWTLSGRHNLVIPDPLNCGVVHVIQDGSQDFKKYRGHDPPSSTPQPSCRRYQTEKKKTLTTQSQIKAILCNFSWTAGNVSTSGNWY